MGSRVISAVISGFNAALCVLPNPSAMRPINLGIAVALGLVAVMPRD